ncbi:type II toxin-antitoxin system RelE/ParE family toxin [Caulobacter segnis]
MCPSRRRQRQRPVSRTRSSSAAEALRDFPERGAPRFDVRPGLRTLPFRRVTITYAVEEGQVVIVGIFYGGQDYESILGGT